MSGREGLVERWTVHPCIEIDDRSGSRKTHRWWEVREGSRLVAHCSEETDAARIAELEARIAHMAGVNNEFLDPDHYWYRQGKDDGIEQERGNVIEWLRGDVADETIHSCVQAADAIEAGEHLK